MQIQINPSLLWGAVFSVPAVIVDRYLTLASPEQLQTLLWVLRHASEQPNETTIADALHFKTENVKEYLLYWQSEGILQLDGVCATPAARSSAMKPEVKPAPTVQKELPDLPDVKPTQAQILARTQEMPELDYLFDQAQKKFGRTIGYDGQCTLLMMHDRYGLPVEVILMIIEYCAEVRKTSNAYIAAMGKSWAQEEIDTIEKAEEKINALHRCGSVWKELASMAGITAPNPTAVQSEYLRSWIYELGYSIDMIFLAYEEMANHCTKLSFAYMNKVLRNWHGKQLRTPQDVAEDNRRFKEKKRQADGQPPASYDINEMEQRLLYGPIVYKKKDD